MGKEARRLVPKCMWGSLGSILCLLRDHYWGDMSSHGWASPTDVTASKLADITGTAEGSVGLCSQLS